MIRSVLVIFALFIILIAVYFPSRHARRYSYVSLNEIMNELSLQWPQHVDYRLKNCSYEDILTNNKEIEIDTVTEEKTFKKPLSGGEFKPEECIPFEKSAIIIPYRYRPYHLNIFIKFMHWYLQKQRIHYRIFVVNQNDSLPFNRAKMLNYGAKLAVKLKYHCLILHDVDLIPINSGNMYACSKMPRHMSSSLDTFRYNLPYLTLFGGAVSITSDQFVKVNGMSNEFYGWGGEDDDFYRRLVRNNLEPCRFSPEVSKYTMLTHKKEKASNFNAATGKYGGNQQLAHNSPTDFWIKWNQEDGDSFEILSDQQFIKLFRLSKEATLELLTDLELLLPPNNKKLKINKLPKNLLNSHNPN